MSFWSLKVSSFKRILFSFGFSVWMSPTALSSSSLSLLMCCSACCWTPIAYFGSVIFLFRSLTSVWSYLIFSFSLMKFSLCSSILPLSSAITFIDYYFKFFIRFLNLCIIKVFFWGSVLFFHLEHISLCHFVWFPVCFYVLDKVALSLSLSLNLEGLASVGDEASHSTLPWFMIISWTFGTVYTTWFILDVSLLLRVCQDLSVFPGEESHLTPSSGS